VQTTAKCPSKELARSGDIRFSRRLLGIVLGIGGGKNQIASSEQNSAILAILIQGDAGQLCTGRDRLGIYRWDYSLAASPATLTRLYRAFGASPEFPLIE